MSGDPIPLDDLDGLLEERMRAYLAGPLTACDPAQAEICRKVRTRAGRVLRTRFTVYDPAEMTPPGTDHTPDQVFNADHTRTSTADLVFFHVNAPSLGVGIESQIAAEATIPRVIAKPKGLKISRMFDGVFNPTIARIEYVDPDDFEQQLLDLLPSIAIAASKSAHKRRPAIEAITSARIGRNIFESRFVLRMTIDDLAAATDIRTSMLRRLERNDAVAATLTLAQQYRLATELKATWAVGGGIPTLQGPADEPGVSEAHKKSLENLYSFLQSRNDEWMPDPEVFQLWDYAYPLGLETAEAARGDDPALSGQPVSVEQWRQIRADLQPRDDGPTLFG
jgi:transcriptional regulator with XRE-family HTH domain